MNCVHEMIFVKRVQLYALPKRLPFKHLKQIKYIKRADVFIEHNVYTI